MKILFFLLVLIFTISELYAQKEKEQVAVLELEVDGLSVSESATLTNRLRSELVKIDSFTIVERSKMNEILDEQGFQMTGCTSSECAVEAGKILSVNRICTGNIGKVGSIYTLTIRLVDVESSKIIKSVTEDCKCPIEDVLTMSIPNVAAKLSGLKVINNESYVVSRGKGDIYIKSDPSGAEIFIDNINTGKITPATLSDVTPGNHELKLVKGDYIGVKIVTVIANELVPENVVLNTNNTGGLKVYSDPVDADIFIDGRNYGKTPKIIKNLPLGSYKVVLKKSPGLIYEQMVDVENIKFTKINGILVKGATLILSSIPSSADIYIDNQYGGKTESDFQRAFKIFPKDKVEIKVKLKDYVTWEKTISLKRNEEMEIKVIFEKERGILKFSTYPDGSSLTIDDKKYKIDNNKIDLPVGKYSLKISCSGYQDKKMDVNVGINETKHIEAALEGKTINGALRRAILPGLGQYYQEKKIRAWVYSLSFFGSVGTSIYFTQQYNTAVIDYNDIRRKYEDAIDDDEIERLRTEMNTKYDDVNSLETTRNIFYATTGAIWLWSIVDVLILPPAWERKVKLSGLMLNDGVMLGVNYKW